MRAMNEWMDGGSGAVCPLCSDLGWCHRAVCVRVLWFACTVVCFIFFIIVVICLLCEQIVLSLLVLLVVLQATPLPSALVRSCDTPALLEPCLDAPPHCIRWKKENT